MRRFWPHVEFSALGVEQPTACFGNPPFSSFVRTISGDEHSAVGAQFLNPEIFSVSKLDGFRQFDGEAAGVTRVGLEEQVGGLDVWGLGGGKV